MIFLLSGIIVVSVSSQLYMFYVVMLYNQDLQCVHVHVHCHVFTVYTVQCTQLFSVFTGYAMKDINIELSGYRGRHQTSHHGTARSQGGRAGRAGPCTRLWDDPL